MCGEDARAVFGRQRVSVVYTIAYCILITCCAIIKNVLADGCVFFFLLHLRRRFKCIELRARVMLLLFVSAGD